MGGPGGSFCVPGADTDAFLQLYADAVVSSGQSLGIVERPRHIGPVRIDLDFRRPSPEPVAGPETVTALVRALFVELRRLVAIDDATDRCYVLAKPPRPDGKGKGGYKDGLHLMIPTVVTRPEVQHLLRDALLPTVAALFGGRCTNSPDDIYDDAVIERNGWLLYGSRKRDEVTPWTLSRVVAPSGLDDNSDGDGEHEQRHTTSELVPLLSIRNKHHETRLTAEGRARLQALLDAREAAEAGRLEIAERRRAALAALPPREAAAHVAGTMDDLALLVGMLSPARAGSYDPWLRVAFGLINVTTDVGGPMGRALELFHQFSATCPSQYAAHEVDAKWDELSPKARPADGRGGERVGMGSFHKWARQDSPLAYLKARFAIRGATPTPSVSPSEAGHTTQGVCAATPWDCSHVIHAAACAIGTTTVPKQVDARIEGGEVFFSADGNDFRIKLATLAVDPTPNAGMEEEPASTTYIHKSPPGVACRKLLLKGESAPAKGWSMTRPDVDTIHMRSDGPPRTELVLDMEGEVVHRATINYPDTHKKYVLKDNMNGAIQTVIKDAIREHLQKDLKIPAVYLNTVVYANNNFGVINNYNNTGNAEEAECSAFEKVRDALLAHSMEHRHRKADGIVYEPVEGCPCAFVAIGKYEEYISRILKHDATFRRHPRRFDELMKFLTNYRDLDELPELRPQLDLLSFANGVLCMADLSFVPYAEIVAGGEGHSLAGKAARHHIDAPYDPENAETPLLDKVLDWQFGDYPGVSDTLLALIGRMLYPLNTKDRWQVMPFLVGLGNTGKSLLLAIVHSLFRKGAVGMLGNKREEIFGMDNIADKEVIIGRDMPAKLSGALAQELMQTMVTGEPMEIARKGYKAISVDWSAPMIMGSNHFPDYANTGNNVGRRIVTLRFDRVVEQLDELLVDKIKDTELPAIVCRALRAYHDMIPRAREAGGFWKAAPRKLLEWQGALASATNKLHDFLSMADDERTKIMTRPDGSEFTWTCSIRRVEGRVTWAADLVAVFEIYKSPDKIKISELDVATLAEFGFKISDKQVYVCKACKQLGHVGCCDNYTRDDRAKRVVIYDMEIIDG